MTDSSHYMTIGLLLILSKGYVGFGLGTKITWLGAGKDPTLG